MDGSLISADVLAGKDEVVLFGEEEATTHVRDFLGLALCPLSGFLSLLDNLAASNDEVRAVAITGKSLLAQVEHLLDQFHESLRQSGLGIFVGVEQPSWEPRAVTACAVKRLSSPAPKEQEVARQRRALWRTCAERMDALVDHPELVKDMLAHMELLVAKTQEAAHV
jgi:hypothetical protein